MASAVHFEDHVFDVIVIGGGISGLVAADELRKRNPSIDLFIVEAKNRVGGRTLTVEMKGLNDKMEKFDLGGQWLAKSQNHIWDYVKEFNLQTFDQYNQGLKMTQLGKVTALRPFISGINESSLRSYSELELLDFHANAKNLQKLCDKLDLMKPFSNDNAQHLDETTVAQWTKEESNSKAVEDIMELGSRIVYGVPFTRMSMLYHLFFSKSAGGYNNLVESAGEGAQAIRVFGGTQQISERLAAQFSATNSIRLSCAVTKIETAPDAEYATIYTYDTTENSIVREVSVYKARKIIVAIPPTQCSRIEWVPEVSFIKRRLFDNMYFGNMIKFVVTYKRTFWREKGLSGEIVSIGRTGVTEKAMPIIDSYDGTAPNGTPALVAFMREEYSDLSREDRKKAAIQDMVRLYGPEAQDYVDYEEKVWGSEPFNGGCPVAYVPPGQMDAFAEIRQPHLNIHFAGTESATHWMGYMSGAVQAGRRAAHEVLFRLKRDDLVQFSYLVDSPLCEEFLNKQLNDTSKSKI